ncbi:hypothetical protein PRIPAC_96631 [Pristionchus pacificus]|uniref:Uncharacterized protein n=1 Tax=Pristionchus pacificus TaxID=54126 RepID=A0A2A6B323_PRIPA|nr:hypothetical protein PRIPAC_96631 [Pristionchus pacificus]|eukprot:PDM60279.1 hypothetical protein PRIPAC_54104 [Pristionchus pacificus]
MLFLPLLLLLPLADALIRLQWSALYDEVDFKGVDQVKLIFRLVAMSCSARVNTEFVVDTQLDYANIIQYSIAGVINVTLAMLVVYLLIQYRSKVWPQISNRRNFLQN